MKHTYLVKLRFLLFLTLSLTASLGAWAQATTGTVSGRVTDAKNEGLPGVTVLVEGTSVGGSTNADGTYTIAGVPAGAHTLVISFIGYIYRPGARDGSRWQNDQRTGPNAG